MSIEKMTLVNISGSREALDDVVLTCYEGGSFHPEIISAPQGKVSGCSALSEENPDTALLHRLETACINAGIELKYDSKAGDTLKADEIESFLETFEKQVQEIGGRKKQLSDSVKEHENALTQLNHIEGMEDVSFEDIFSCKYLKVRFGRLPSDSYSKLEYYNNKVFLFIPLDMREGEDFYWGIYFTPEEFAAEVDYLFSLLFFERLRIPDYVQGTPEHAIELLQQALEKEKTALAECSKELRKLIEAAQEKLLVSYSRIRFLNDSFDLRRYVYFLGDQFHITGFLPEREKKEFGRRFSQIPGADVAFLPYDSDKRLTPPTKLKNCRFFKPFEMFVDMYGLPAYDDIDPTPIVGITYTLLFGLMFGDLGQGLLISLLGWVMWKWKKMNLGRIMIRIGFSSAVFGCIYGSVFGFENLLDPIYHAIGLAGKPIEVMAPESTNLILIGAVALGAVIIVASILTNIVMGLKQRNFERAIFGNNGLAGLIFYGSVLAAAVLLLVFQINILNLPFILLCIVLPLLVIFLKEPLTKFVKGYKHVKPEEGIGSFIIENFFELFEVLLSFITNTMSFLRVGGFVLSHAGMMAVVMTLSSMFTSASPVIVVIGNLFVMAMEGLIVGIQVLRLEFYEMFSRYYEGDGKPFQPVSALAEVTES